MSNLLTRCLFICTLFLKFVVILVSLFIEITIVVSESILNDQDNYVRLFIYIPILIGFIIFYLSLGRKVG